MLILPQSASFFQRRTQSLAAAHIRYANKSFTSARIKIKCLRFNYIWPWKVPLCGCAAETKGAEFSAREGLLSNKILLEGLFFIWQVRVQTTEKCIHASTSLRFYFSYSFPTFCGCKSLWPMLIGCRQVWQVVRVSGKGIMFYVNGRLSLLIFLFLLHQ